MKDFYYRENIVGCRQYIIGPSSLNPKVCFCCGKKTVGGESVVLLINNYKSFSNVLIHEDCFKMWENNTDGLCKDLEESYKKYKELEKIF